MILNMDFGETIQNNVDMKIKLLGFYFLLILAYTFLSCNRINKIDQIVDSSNMDTIMYDIQTGNTIARDEALDNVRFIKLETTKDNLIGKIDQVVFGDSTIIVVDKKNAKAIYLFDYDGKYVGRISRIGNGPNEYIGIKYVTKRTDGKIAVFDELKSHIMLFDERGSYISEIKTDLFANSFEFMDTTNIIFNISNRYYRGYKPYDCYSYALKDMKMDIKYLFGYAYFGEDFHMVRNFNLYNYGDTLYCNVNFKDIIYVMEKDGVSAKYNLILKPHSASDFLFKTQDEYESIRKEYSFFDGDFIELRDYSYIHYRGMSSKLMFDLIYNHKTNTTKSISYYFNSPLLSFFSYPITRYSDNTLVCCANASQVMKYKDNLFEKSGATDELSLLYKDLSADSNPILFFYEVIAQ